jgi:hypothetical protein
MHDNCRITKDANCIKPPFKSLQYIEIKEGRRHISLRKHVPCCGDAVIADGRLNV